MSEGINEPPTVRGIAVSREVPFVEIQERYETRSDHLTMAGFMLLATALALVTGPVAFAVVTAFGAGFAVNEYRAYPDRYDVEEVSA